MHTVAAFCFVDRDSSYAAKTGRPENIGVIGLIAIEDQVPQPAPMLEKKQSFGAQRSAGQAGSIGTEYGREIDSRVYYVPFVRSSNRQAITCYYDTLAAPRSAGVPVDALAPVPFPADPQFAPPPPGYNWLRVKQCMILAVPGAIAGTLLMFLLLTFSEEILGFPPPYDLDYLELELGLLCCGAPLLGAGGVITLWLLYRRRQGPPRKHE